MTSENRLRLSHHLLEPILAVVLLTAILPTIAVYRAAVQPDYAWGLFLFRGTGVTAAYWGVVVVAIFCWVLLFLGLAGPRRPFRPLLLLWAGLQLGTLLYGAVRHNAVLRGDAWGIEVGVGWGVLFFGAVVVAAAVLWVVADVRSSTAHPVTPISRRRASLALALAPGIVLLFHFGDGEAHTIFDRIAIGLVVVQGIVVAAAFRSSSGRNAT